MKQVWNCGGGTQSVAIGVLIIQGRLPKPDLSVIADTGRECNSTWEYLNSFLNPALSKVGLEVVRVGQEFAYSHDGLFSNNDETLIPAFTTESGDVGKLRNFCNRWWKQDVIDNWLSRVHGITESKRVKWIGFSLDEAVRASRMIGGKEFKSGRIRIPLVFEVPMRRYQCVELVEAFGLPTPPRSRCWLCPNQSDAEWKALPKDEFQAAVLAEREIRARDPQAWFHRSCQPLDQVNFNAQQELTVPCDSGNCFL